MIFSPLPLSKISPKRKQVFCITPLPVGSFELISFAFLFCCFNDSSFPQLCYFLHSWTLTFISYGRYCSTIIRRIFETIDICNSSSSNISFCISRLVQSHSFAVQWIWMLANYVFWGETCTCASSYTFYTFSKFVLLSNEHFQYHNNWYLSTCVCASTLVKVSMQCNFTTDYTLGTKVHAHLTMKENIRVEKLIVHQLA